MGARKSMKEDMNTLSMDSSLNSSLIDERLLADIAPRKKKPDWVRKESLISVGAWETLFHRRRTGDTWADIEKFYEYEHSEAFVKEILQVGGNLLLTAFAKNYYIDEEEFLLKKQLAALCKKHRLRLGAYIRGDNIYAELFPDLLRKEDILSFDARGSVSTYNWQEWRKNLCLHKPKVMEMLKENIHRAVADLGVDMLFFDGYIVGGMETVDACRCDTCRKDFTEFLKLRYGNDPVICKHRFGHTNLAAIEPPGLFFKPTAPSGLITEPVWQEWLVFRCTWTARFARTVAAYVQELDPNVAIMINNSVQAKENLALMLGYDVWAFGGCADVFYNESGYHPRITPDGRILQHAREYKLTADAGCFGWTHLDSYGDTPRKLRIEIAHAAMFNRGRVTEYGHAFGCYTDFKRLAEIKKPFARWLKTHWKDYQNLREIADVVVWRERTSMAFSAPITFATAMQVEQLLIEDRVPFTISQNIWPTDTRVIVLPNLVTLREECCRKITQFVKEGGSVLVVGSTSFRDGWVRKRSDFGLREILPDDVRIPEICYQQHIAAAGVAMDAGKEIARDAGVFRYHPVGKGRVVHVSSLVDPVSLAPLFNPDHTFNLGVDLTNWITPVEAGGLRLALAWLLQERPMMRVETERGVLANYYRQNGTGRVSCHLVNLQEKAVSPVVFTMVIPTGSQVASVSVISPDGADFEQYHWKARGEHLVVEVDRLDVYSVIIIQTKSELSN